jgi:4-methyl-5(b-hydroxyethyl)-thiazole monophosphate biosynthesis
VKKVLMFLSQGFEDLEAASIIDVLGWTQVRDHLKQIELKTISFHDEVKGRFGLRLKADFIINKNQIDFTEFDAFVIVGGFHSHGFNEAYSEEIHQIAKEFNNTNRPIATFCVGILPLADASLLHNKKATTYSLSQFHDNVKRLKSGGAIYTQKNVEVDENIISCSGPKYSLEVAYILLELLTGKENMEEVKMLMSG